MILHSRIFKKGTRKIFGGSFAIWLQLLTQSNFQLYFYMVIKQHLKAVKNNLIYKYTTYTIYKTKEFRNLEIQKYSLRPNYSPLFPTTDCFVVVVMQMSTITSMSFFGAHNFRLTFSIGIRNEIRTKSFHVGREKTFQYQ